MLPISDRPSDHDKDGQQIAETHKSVVVENKTTRERTPVILPQCQWYDDEAGKALRLTKQCRFYDDCRNEPDRIGQGSMKNSVIGSIRHLKNSIVSSMRYNEYSLTGGGMVRGKY